MTKILFLDISSSCTGYTLGNIDEDTCIIEESGVIWFDSKDNIEDKCYSLYKFITSYKDLGVIVFERYSFNMKQPNGSLNLPHLIGAAMVASSELVVAIESITPQTWRKNCGIKYITTKGKRDYKTPTIEYFDNKYPDIPKKIQSNITGNMRSTPNDYYDSLGVCEGWCVARGITEFKRSI